MIFHDGIRRGKYKIRHSYEVIYDLGHKFALRTFIGAVHTVIFNFSVLTSLSVLSAYLSLYPSWFLTFPVVHQNMLQMAGLNYFRTFTGMFLLEQIQGISLWNKIIHPENNTYSNTMFFVKLFQFLFVPALRNLRSAGNCALLPIVFRWDQTNLPINPHFRLTEAPL